MFCTSIFKFVRLALAFALVAPTVCWAEAVAPAPEPLFEKHCAICHQALTDSGQRATDLYPSLVAIARERTARQMVAVILNGKFDRAGERAGETIPTMPAHDYLSNEGVANLVNYVRQDAGVDGQVSTEEVAMIRGKATGHQVVELSAKEYAQADGLYQSKCAGCHAVDRSGRSGAALYEWALAARGVEAVKLQIHFGSPWGMPNWGMREELGAEEITLLARYLATPARSLPVFDYDNVFDSWQSDPAQLPKQAEPDSIALVRDLFVSLLHDTGEIMLLDGAGHEILAVVDAVDAPNEVVRSPDGRYLYVMSRGADIVQFDLGVVPVRQVGHVKVGYEGRSLALSDDGSTLAAGAYWPPQLVFLDALNLAPKSVVKLDEKAYRNNRTDAEISQVIALPGEKKFLATSFLATSFLATSKAAGDYFVVDSRRGILSKQHGRQFLRAGSKDLSGQYLLTPTDDGAIVVFDLRAKRIVRTIEAHGLIGGSRGTSYKDPSSGVAIWAASSLGNGSIVKVTTDGAPRDWTAAVVEDSSWGGSLNMISHPAATHLWVDFPLNGMRDVSRSVGVVSKTEEIQAMQKLSAVRLAGLASEEFARAVHPQFNLSGSEVWVTLWNRQDQNSAILVLNESTLNVVKVIKDPRLITPIRTFSLPYH